MPQKRNQNKMPARTNITHAAIGLILGIVLFLTGNYLGRTLGKVYGGADESGRTVVYLFFLIVLIPVAWLISKPLKVKSKTLGKFFLISFLIVYILFILFVIFHRYL